MAFPVRPDSRASSVWERVGRAVGYRFVSCRGDANDANDHRSMVLWTGFTTPEKIVDNCGDQDRSLWGEQVELKLVRRQTAQENSAANA